MKFITAIAIVLLSSSTGLAQTNTRHPACDHPDPLIRDASKCRWLQQNDANFQDYLKNVSANQETQEQQETIIKVGVIISFIGLSFWGIQKLMTRKQ